MKVTSAAKASGFTMVETLIGLGVLTAVGVACYSMLLSSTILFAKNVSVNTSGTILRTALDRMYIDINQAYGVPKLINPDGTLVTTPPATGVAGIIFDLYLGGPYVVTNSTGTGFTASTTSFSMKCSTDTLTNQPIPVANDVIVLDNGPTRPVVSSCTSSVSSGVRTVTVNLKSTARKCCFLECNDDKDRIYCPQESLCGRFIEWIW